MKSLYVLILVWCMAFTAQAQPEIKERNILANEAKSINLEQALLPDNSWNTLPGYKNRDFWNGLPENIRKNYIEQAEKYLNYNWPTVKATDYLELIRSGDRRQNVYAECNGALIALVMGELTEGKGRFIDQIVNAVWFYSEQTWWGWSAHLGTQKAGAGLPDVNEPTIDLGVSNLTSDLSWTLYLFREEFDNIHPLISKRLNQEIHNKSLDPYFERNDFWYMGFNSVSRPNNWNPWINHNMLMSYLLMETDPKQKVQRIEKILLSIDKFLNIYPDDGGCDEGPSYWGAAGAYLYECLEMMYKATKGKFDVYDNQLVKNIGTYFHQVNIHAPYFINFADADAKTNGKASIIYRYGKAIKDPAMQKFGAYLAELNNWGTKGVDGKICDQIRDLNYLDEIRNAEKEEALVADFWFPDTEIAGGRDKAGSIKGFFFGAKGGFNAESHNHNDIGSCLMYYDGKPCLIDLGREEYVAKTFSPQRYEIWTMQSGYHNLPVINGTDQKEGISYKAKNSSFKANSKSVFFSTDIAGAYTNNAKVKSWVRSYTLNRGKSFVIGDSYELTEVTGQPVSSNLITYCKVSEVKPGQLRFDGDGFSLNMSYDSKLVKPEIEFIEINDQGLKRYWPNGVTRVKMNVINPQVKGNMTLIFSK